MKLLICNLFFFVLQHLVSLEIFKTPFFLVFGFFFFLRAAGIFLICELVVLSIPFPQVSQLPDSDDLI